MQLVAWVLLHHENEGQDKHVESILVPGADEGSIPSSSTLFREEGFSPLVRVLTTRYAHISEQARNGPLQFHYYNLHHSCRLFFILVLHDFVLLDNTFVNTSLVDCAAMLSGLLKINYTNTG